jgi:signal transduction histidine kinase
VRLDLGDAVAQLWVSDDGRGFTPSTVDSGFGLVGMRERLELVGGSVTVDSGPGRGTRLTVRVPVAS